MTRAPETLSTPGAAESWRRFGGEAVLAWLGFLALSLWYLRPIWRYFDSRLAPDLGDPLFNLVVLDWGIAAIKNGLADFWNLPIFFPESGATAYSDHLLGPAAISALLSPLLPNTVAAYNLLFLASFVGSGFSSWWVLRRSGLSTAAAFLGGCMFAFSSFRWDELSHLQILWMLWIPPVLWTFHRLLEQPGVRRAVVFALFYGLHATGGCYLAYMIHVPLLVLLWQHRTALRAQRSRRAWLVLIATGLLCAAVMAAVAWPYLARAGTQKREPAEILDHGATLASYLSASIRNAYGGLSLPWRRPGNTLFLGILPTLVLLAALPRIWRRRRHLPATLSPRRRWTLRAPIALAATSFLLSEVMTWYLALGNRAFDERHRLEQLLGGLFLVAGISALGLRRVWTGDWPLSLRGLPSFERALAISTLVCALLTFPAAYLPLMRVVPGLAGMRVPTRFFAFVSFGLAWVAAGLLDRWWLRLREGRRRLATAACGVVLLLDLRPTKLPWRSLVAKEDLPAVYHWLAKAPDVSAVLELPLGDYTKYIEYMYAATLHHKPLVGGYSGYLAPHYAALRETCCRPVPDADDLARLRGWGVSHILVHAKRPGPLRRMQRWAEQDGIKLEFQDRGDFLFRILPPE